MRLCPRCKKRQKKKHLNSKWCHPCAEELKKRPKSTLTPMQQRQVIALRGKLSGRQIAKKIGTSWSNVMRFARDRGISLATKNGTMKYRMRPDLIRDVCEFYQEHGFSETQKAFPGVKVRSIIDRYKLYKPRRTRWTPEQHIEAVRMAGLVPLEAQARYFNRPGANLGAMKSFWMKRIKMSGGTLHGMAEWNAREVVTDRCPRIETGHWTKRDYKKKSRTNRTLTLWIDAEKHLKPGTPEFLATGVRTMAEFSRWVFGSKNPKRAILRMIRERA